MLSRSAKLSLVESVPFWWHTIDLGDGVITPGQTSLLVEEKRASTIPRPLEGKSVLDIGCWDGYFSFWCEQHGAHVTPVDNLQYVHFVEAKYGVSLSGGEGFKAAASCLGSKLSLKKEDFTTLRNNGAFDIVLFFGILYHQRHPLAALEHLYRLCKKCLVLESHYLKGIDEPIMKFYKGNVLNRDPTNYWGPSSTCIEQMLNEVGFRRVLPVCEYWDNDDRIIFIAEK